MEGLNRDPVAVYVHTPFCPSKCGYCDFNSFEMRGPIIERTVEAMVREIERSPWRGRPAKTIFFGGGTPTFLEEPMLLAILEAAIRSHPPIEGAEITCEANPGTADASKFQAMRRAGFNRISLGAQSFSSEELLRLGRVHQATDVGRAVAIARSAGFANLNLDLMFALPGQAMRAWESNLDTALTLEPDHLSLYCLTIEPNTRYYKLHLRGMLDLPDDECQVAMYETAHSKTSAAGLEPYEISNFAKPGFECRHNREYWLGNEYLGYGPGAVGCVGSEWVPWTEAALNSHRVRYTNVKHPERYSYAIEENKQLWCDWEGLSADTLAFERLMLGIRLAEGVPSASLDPDKLKKTATRGWTEVVGDNVRLTPTGRHFCSEVAIELS